MRVPVAQLDTLGVVEAHADSEPVRVPLGEGDGERVKVAQPVVEALRDAEPVAEGHEDALRVLLELAVPELLPFVEGVAEGEADTVGEAVAQLDGDADPEDVAVPLTDLVQTSEALVVAEIDKEPVFTAVGDDEADSEGDPEADWLPVPHAEVDALPLVALEGEVVALCVRVPEALSVPVEHPVPDGVDVSERLPDAEPVGDSDGELVGVKLGEPELHAETVPVLVPLSHGEGVPDADTDAEAVTHAVTVPLREMEGDPDREPVALGHPL